MKGWPDCPDCWGCGLVAGWIRPCIRPPDLDDLPPELREIGRRIIRELVKRVLQKIISDNQLKLR